MVVQRSLLVLLALLVAVSSQEPVSSPEVTEEEVQTIVDDESLTKKVEDRQTQKIMN